MHNTSVYHPGIYQYAKLIDNEEKRLAFTQASKAFIRLRNGAEKNIIDMACQLQLIQQLLPKGKFFEFAQEVLGLRRSSVFNYLKIHDVATRLFSENGRLDYENANKLSFRAYQLIGHTENDELFSAIRHLVKKSEDRVDISKIRALFESRNNQVLVQLEDAALEIESLKKTLEMERAAHLHDLQQKELSLSQLKAQLEELDRFSAKQLEHKHLLENEILQLRKTSSKPIIKEVAVLPAELASLEDALAHMENLIEIKQEQVDSLDRQLAGKNQFIEKSKTRHTRLIRYISELESITANWADVHIHTLTDDPQIRSIVNQYGQALIRFGHFICGDT